MKHYTSYLWYILKHKYYVLLEGLKLNVPLWILILHDWDKFLPDEFIPYARATRDKDGKDIFVGKSDLSWSRAVKLHFSRNKHHWQWWIKVMLNAYYVPVYIRNTNIMIWNDGDMEALRKSGTRFRINEHNHLFFYEPIPDPWRREMLADWRGAGRALGKPDTLAWYTKNRDTLIKFIHPDTIKWIEGELGYE